MSEMKKLLMEQLESGNLQIRQTETGTLVIESAGEIRKTVLYQLSARIKTGFSV